MKILEEIALKLSTLKEDTSCIDEKGHKIIPFTYQGVESDFELVCTRCGGIDINQRGIYSHIGLIHYIDSERYESLLAFSAKIKEQNKITEDKKITN